MWIPGFLPTCTVAACHQEDTPVNVEVASCGSVHAGSLRCSTVLVADNIDIGFDLVCAHACTVLAKGCTPITNRTTIQLDSVVPRSPACAASVADGAEPQFSFAELAWGFGTDDIRRLLLGSVKFLALRELLMLCSAETSSWFLCRNCNTTCKTDSDMLYFTDGSFTAAGEVTPALMGWAVAFFHNKRDSAKSLECLGVAAGRDRCPHACMAKTLRLVRFLPSVVHCPWRLWQV